MKDGPGKRPNANPGALKKKGSEVEAMKNATYIKHLKGEGSTAVHGKKKARRQFPSRAEFLATKAKKRKRKN